MIRVAVEVAGHVSTKPYPKSKAGRRDVPLPPFVVSLLDGYADTYRPGPLGEVFTNTAGGPMRRTLFRSRIWRPALVRAGLLGQVAEIGPDTFLASWRDSTGIEQTKTFAVRRDATKHVAQHAIGGLRFPRPASYLRHLAGVGQRTDQRGQRPGTRADLDNAEPLHARIPEPSRPRPSGTR